MDAWPGLEIDTYFCAAHFIVPAQVRRAAAVSKFKFSTSTRTASDLLKRVLRRKTSPSRLYYTMAAEDDNDALPIEPAGESSSVEPAVSDSEPTAMPSGQPEKIPRPIPLPRTISPEELAIIFNCDSATSEDTLVSEQKRKPRIPRPKSTIQQPNDFTSASIFNHHSVHMYDDLYQYKYEMPDM